MHAIRRGTPFYSIASGQAGVRRANTRYWAAVWCAFLVWACCPTRAAEHVILYLSRAPSVRDVFARDQPELQKVLTNGALAVMTIGPAGADPLATLREGRYVRADEPVEDAGFPQGVVPIFEPLDDPPRGDALLIEARRQYPDAPVIALHAGPRVPPASDGIAASLTVPTWVAISTMHGRPYTETTRHAGIVSNLDIAPTVYRQLHGQSPAGMPGSPMWGEGDAPIQLRHGMPYHVDSAVGLQDALLTLARATIPVNFTIAFGGIVLLFLAAWRVARRRERNGWLQYALVGLLVAPVGVAVAAGQTPSSLSTYLLLAVGATLALLAFVAIVGRVAAFGRVDILPTTLLLATGGLTAYIAVDIERGGFPLALSPLSNFYLTGIRFYGLGNEYAALFLACGVLAGLLTVQRSGTRQISAAGLALLGGWFLLLCLLVGWPGLGANMGGLLTGLVTGGIAWTIAARRSGARHAWVWPVMAAIGTVGAVIWTDTHSASATHVGRFVQSAAHGSPSPLDMLANKVAIQWGLFTAPPAFIIYAAAIAFVFLLRGPLAVPRARLFRQWPWAAIAVPALLIGGAFGMVLNDTGIVMWGLMGGVALGAAAILALEPGRMAIINE
jgi:hypothetical protein